MKHLLYVSHNANNRNILHSMGEIPNCPAGTPFWLYSSFSGSPVVGIYAGEGVSRGYYKTGYSTSLLVDSMARILRGAPSHKKSISVHLEGCGNVSEIERIFEEKGFPRRMSITRSSWDIDSDGKSARIFDFGIEGDFEIGRKPVIEQLKKLVKRYSD